MKSFDPIDLVIDLNRALENGDGAAWLVSFIWREFDQLAHSLSQLIADVALPLIGPVMMLLFTWLTLRMILMIGDLKDQLHEIIKISFFGAIGTILLANTAIFLDYLIYPLLNAGAEAGQLILFHTLSAEMRTAIEKGVFEKSAFIQGVPVAEMVWTVGRQIDWIILLGQRIVDGDGGFMSTLNTPFRLLGALPLLGLGIFVLVLFVGYVVEALYSFLVGAVLAPLTVVAFVSPKGRPYAGALIRMMLNGALLLILLSTAMGVTGRFASLLEPVVIAEITGVSPDQIDAAKEKVKNCTSPTDCDEARTSLEKIQIADQIVIFGPGYVLLLVSLGISILIHMRSKTLASNLTSVNDGPGPAAAIAGIGTAGAGVLWGASKWAAAKAATPLAKGAGAVGRRMPFSFSGGGEGSNAPSSIRGATERRVPTDNFTAQSSPHSSPVGGSQGSSTPGMSDLNKSLQELIKTLKQGGGR